MAFRITPPNTTADGVFYRIRAVRIFVACADFLIRNEKVSLVKPIAWRPISALCCCLAFLSCAGADLTAKDPRRAMPEKGKAVVLLKVAPDLNGKPLREIGWLPSRSYLLTLTPMDWPETSNEFGDAFTDSPSPESREAGWIYWVLEPGTYHLEVIPPDKLKTVEAGVSPHGRQQASMQFQFFVPRERLVVYVGSLLVSCKGKANWSGPRVEKCSRLRVENQADTARTVAESGFRYHGPVSTAVMREYGGPVSAQAGGQLLPMGLLTACTKDIASPNWTRRALLRNVRWPVGLLEGASGPYVAAVAGGYMVFAVVRGELTKKKMQPCLQEITRELYDLDPAAILSHSLTSLMKKNGLPGLTELKRENCLAAVAANPGLRSLLEAKIIRMELVECRGSQSNRFCVEVALRARVLNLASGEFVYDTVLVHSYADNAVRVSKPYEVAVSYSSRCREIEAYCGDKGREVFRREVSEAMEAFAARIFRDLRLKQK
jgi:hypothetical protein